ncbi:MAG: hypothetical protein ABJE95_06405 [Byssovorax sp.]
MFILQKAQYAAFQRAAVDDFAERMVTHLVETFPDESEERGEAGIRALIRLGIERAARHQLVQEYDVCLYLHVMLALGERFDDDPALSWARAALEEAGSSASIRIEMLHDRVFEDEDTAEGALFP